MDTKIVYKQTILPVDLEANWEFNLVNQGQVCPIVRWCALYILMYLHDADIKECLTVPVPGKDK